MTETWQSHFWPKVEATNRAARAEYADAVANADLKGRLLLELHRPDSADLRCNARCMCCGSDYWPCPAIAMVLPDHPDYCEQWRP